MSDDVEEKKTEPGKGGSGETPQGLEADRGADDDETPEEVHPRLATPDRPFKFRYIFPIKAPRGGGKGRYVLPSVVSVAEGHRKGTGEDI